MELQANMECRSCGFKGDDVQDFQTTDTPGERFCPMCNSGECYIIKQEEPHATTTHTQ